MRSRSRITVGLLAASMMALAAQGQAAEGEKIYQKSCKMCHATGMMGAPKIGDKAAWQPRIEARDRDTMVAGTIKGFGRMMPRGGCRSCSDDDIAAAVDYLRSKVE